MATSAESTGWHAGGRKPSPCWKRRPGPDRHGDGGGRQCRLPGGGRTPGLALRTARDLCPEATVLPPDPAGDQAARADLLALLDDISPGVEPDGAEGAWFDAREFHGATDARLAQTVIDQLAARRELLGRVALGPGKSITQLAARRLADGETVTIPPEGAAAYLAPLPVAYLPLRPQALQRLHRPGWSRSASSPRCPPRRCPAVSAGRRPWPMRLPAATTPRRCTPVCRPRAERSPVSWSRRSSRP